MGELIVAARGAGYRYPGATEPALADVSVELSGGELLGVVGPNGSGKTTLLRLLMGLLRPDEGSVTLDRRDAWSWDRRALARVVGVVVQREEPAFPLRVRQAVLLGRYPHLSPLARPAAADREAVEQALRRCDVAHLADRWVGTLSGGEWQRVRVARALAQAPRALMLDEATANLDLRHEMELLELVSELVRSGGLGALVVTHHVNLAARFADRVLLLDRGRTVASGPPRTVLTRSTLEQVFQWPVETTDWRGIPQLIPLRKDERP